MTDKQLLSTARTANRELLHTLKLLGGKEPSHPLWIQTHDLLRQASDLMNAAVELKQSCVDSASSQKKLAFAAAKMRVSQPRTRPPRQPQRSTRVEVKTPAKI